MPAGPLCAYDDAQQSSDPETDTKVPDSSDPQATLSAAQVTRKDVADRKKGIGFSGTGFTPDSKATVTVVGTDGSKYSPKTKLTVDEKGKVSGTYFFSVTDDAKVPSGKYSLYLTDEKTEKDSSKVSFEVVPNDSDIKDDAKGSDCTPATGPASDPSETATDDPSESASSEPTETKSEEPSEKPTETKEARKPAAPKPTETETKSPEPPETETSEPTKSQTPEPTETETSEPTDTGSSEPSETAEDESDDSAEEDKAPDTTAPASPGTDDEEKEAATTATQALIIDPTEISSEDFLNEGIKLGITGAQPGEKISITVEHAQGKVDRYTMTKEADSEGKATFGVQAKVKSVLGTYNVTAQADSFDKPQGGSFTVVTNGTSVDEDGGNGSDSGNDLPRTGAEMTGLALGVGLLVVGAAAVVITRRRMTASDDPAEF
ncbi:LPXTG cell wall anchor domain-containing protein [Brevibacterium picturae]|uniref:LPXTG-motif cell wall anchor domain-containing protein n=1 Tax=Brevibacterium picturae TaxID=260553 RepID=A0ABP4MPY8_9MICO